MIGIYIPIFSKEIIYDDKMHVYCLVCACFIATNYSNWVGSQIIATLATTFTLHI